ncbi:ATP-binding cassette domain-containing protein [Lachnospiraceae bacterium WCA-9-b2]|jgi:ABC-type multidrug transport system, ATPase component|uniref:ATP-binding cassette domain-containing protein n=1 Tax=Sporofaciens musculi TaxID=2681861 RepID=A0A7X3MJP1_9FIRM|nr:ABC transporter ATP-binding protein [Sporofaciens musculi]MCI9421921.1 ABC transporter ATP-binding protein [Dorea sp.]MXP77673.1 ATP-binding cassette domain-containing protein [Sporofaciens musculi]
MERPLLTIKNLSAWYNSKKMVLSDFSLELAEHEVVGLIGLNGAGKTTFLKVLSGMLTSFYSNGIWLYDRHVNLREQDFKFCRYTVFAEDNSFQYFTFREYLSYVFSAYRKELPDVSELLRGFHFENYTDVLLKDLSTGNHKKVFLITAFALKPTLLLLDEPVNGLDFQSTEYLYQQIAGYKKYGTVLFSSHILESITLTSDRIFILEDGKIRQTFECGQIDAANIREALRYENDL